MALYRDRADAGRTVARRLSHYAGRQDLLVLGLPRGGVVVAYEVARALGAPLDVLLVRKLGAPGQEELAMGAIASGGVRVLNADVIRALGITPPQIEQVAQVAQQELERRERFYRGDRPRPMVEGRTVIVVDDGLATGASMHAAAVALRAMNPGRIVMAVPVAAPEVCATFRDEVDEVHCAATPQHFLAVGLWYENFAQTTDEEVRGLLERAEHGGTSNLAAGEVA